MWAKVWQSWAWNSQQMTAYIQSVANKMNIMIEKHIKLAKTIH
jgi:hypothetical protein